MEEENAFVQREYSQGTHTFIRLEEPQTSSKSQTNKKSPKLSSYWNL
jgi:hypothetical protein